MNDEFSFEHKYDNYVNYHYIQDNYCNEKPI